jgi:D-alanine transaminase
MNFPCRCAATPGRALCREGLTATVEIIVLVYLNGDFIPLEDARVSVQDRGFLFADGVYEVVRVYGGQHYQMPEHLDRMRRGLAALQIEYRDMAGIAQAAERLLKENQVDGDGTVYIQVTRGAAKRKHAFPPRGTAPTVYITGAPYTPYPAEYWEDGVAAVTLPDTRWARCDIKSISLLPNVMANQEAHARDAFEAIFVRDGMVTEGSHSNVWGVDNGQLVTHPSSNYILPGITRARVFEIAEELGLEVVQRVINLSELYDLDEVFLSGTTTEIMPVVRIDDREIVDGEPGPVTRKVSRAFHDGLPG